MARPSPTDVTVITVTYAERASHVERLVGAVREQGVEQIVVVDNASSPSSAERLRGLASRPEPAVDLVRLGSNEGSAGGYHAGLSHFLTAGARSWAWLLDDDNVPAEAALAALLRVVAAETERPHEHGFALMSLREDRLYLREVAEGRPVERAYPPRSSFLGFEAAQLPAKVLQRLRNAVSPRRPAPRRQRPVAIPFGPYGGLLLSRSLVRTIGLPDRSFHLYADDNEYTARIPRAGAPLLLVPDSVVRDEDEAWNAARRGGTSMRRLLEAGDDHRIFYAVRNQVVFERRHWVDDERRYARNRRIYLWMLRASAHTRDQRRRLEVIGHAVSEGDAMA